MPSQAQHPPQMPITILGRPSSRRLSEGADELRRMAGVTDGRSRPNSCWTAGVSVSRWATFARRAISAWDCEWARRMAAGASAASAVATAAASGPAAGDADGLVPAAPRGVFAPSDIPADAFGEACCQPQTHPLAPGPPAVRDCTQCLPQCVKHSDYRFLRFRTGVPPRYIFWLWLENIVIASITNRGNDVCLCDTAARPHHRGLFIVKIHPVCYMHLLEELLPSSPPPVATTSRHHHRRHQPRP